MVYLNDYVFTKIDTHNNCVGVFFPSKCFSNRFEFRTSSLDLLSLKF